MRDHRTPRNPRYAPEYLERKLSPSAMIGSMYPVAGTTAAEPPPPPDDPYPIEYPPGPPLNPVGPA